MGRPNHNKDKVEANKEYLKLYRTKNSRVLQIVDRPKTIPCPNILIITQLWTC